MYIELSIIGAFVKRSKRDRYREILSDARLRREFTDKLAHFVDFDPKYRVPIPSNKLFVDNIARELQRRHCPKIVYAISETPLSTRKNCCLLTLSIKSSDGAPAQSCPAFLEVSRLSRQRTNASSWNVTTR